MRHVVGFKCTTYDTTRLYASVVLQVLMGNIGLLASVIFIISVDIKKLPAGTRWFGFRTFFRTFARFFVRTFFQIFIVGRCFGFTLFFCRSFLLTNIISVEQSKSKKLSKLESNLHSFFLVFLFSLLSSSIYNNWR